MNYEAILFDMDGVIIDTHQSVTDFWLKYAALYQVHLSETDWEQRIYGCPPNHTFDLLFPDLNGDQRQAILDDLVEYEAHLTYTALSGVLSFLHALKEKNIPTALVTSGDRRKVKAVTGQLGLAGAFSTTITVEDIRRGKPDPECYLRAAQALQKSPERCLVFEDSISGVKAAAAAGALCIGVQLPSKSAHLFQAGARYAVPDFRGVNLLAGDGHSAHSINLQIGAECSLPLLVN
ncbi:MAG: HAD family phosphatase [Chloroflexota bacterium]